MWQSAKFGLERDTDGNPDTLRRRAYAIIVAAWFIELLLMEWIRIETGPWADKETVIARVVWFVSGLLSSLCWWKIIERLQGWQFWKLVTVTIVVAVLIGILHTVTNRTFLFWIADRWPDSSSMAILYYSNARFWLHFHLALACVIVALIYATQVKREQEGRSKAQALAQQAQIQAFRYQIHPHFLFNSFNSIAALILDGRNDKAEQMIRRLSSFLRRGLSNKATYDVLLEEELAQQREYLELERERFPDRLILDFDVPEELHDVVVPGFILQPLVENAVRHGVGNSVDPTTITVSAAAHAKQLRLAVLNSGGPPAELEQTKSGLTYVENRLSARFGEDFSFRYGPGETGGYIAVMEIPLLRPHAVTGSAMPVFASGHPL